MKITAIEIKPGMIIEHKNDYWKVLKTQHVKPGKGGAFNQVELKSIIKGTKLNERFRSSETIEKSELEEKKFNFLYSDENNCFFMDNETFEQVDIPKSITEEKYKLLKENLEVTINFLEEKIRSLGTAACPPYHLAIVIGGTSAELTLKTVKLASCKYLDTLPTQGNKYGQAFRDLIWEQKVHKLTQSLGIGAQFGGKYFCHDVRVIRLPRHGASCPVGIGVSCSADRQAIGKITADGIFLEKLETDPSQYLPEVTDKHLDGDVLAINLNRPMKEVLSELSKYPVKSRLSLTGSLIVARDIAHAKIKERLDKGYELPEYFKDFGIYYAGPAKKPDGMVSGSFGPTTAGRMDSYVNQFQSAGGSMIMLAKGNRSQQVTESCKKYGGFYLGSVGGPGARLAQDCITNIELVEYEELGMEAIWKIEIIDFPAFIIVDDKGNDFFSEFKAPIHNE